MFDRPIARIAVFMLMDLSAQRIIRSTKNRRKCVCRSYDPQPFEQVVKALSVEVEVVNSYAARKLSPDISSEWMRSDDRPKSNPESDSDRWGWVDGTPAG